MHLVDVNKRRERFQRVVRDGNSQEIRFLDWLESLILAQDKRWRRT